jgi:two-component system, sensor histidine kinase YesM
VKKTPESSISIGLNIFIATMGIVFVVLFLTTLVFLVVFSDALDDLVESQSREINKQIVMNFESYINSVIETANYIQFASINLDLGRDATKLGELYQANAEIKRDMVSIFLFDSAGRRLLGPDMDYLTAQAVIKLPWFLPALEMKEIFHFHAGQEASLAVNRDESVISVSKAIEYSRNGIASVGVLLIELNDDAIIGLARKTNLGDSGHLLILDEFGQLLYSSESQPWKMTESSLDLAAGMYIGSRRAAINRLDMYVNVNTLAQTRWRIVTVGNVNKINDAMSRLGGILVIIFLVSIAVSAMVAAVISMRVSRPINQLKTAMLKIEDGDFSHPIELSGQKEIALLAQSFNSMVLKVQELMARLVAQQKDKRKTEFRALQNQINPHFLYNTLDSIVWLAEHRRHKDVITTVVSLARFFRISISKGETFITVDDEISHAQNYLTIQSIRYVDKFTYSMDIQDEMRSLKVMKLILQPLVENAIYHGVGDADGHIAISGRIEGNFLVFRVRNTGYGISEDTIRKMYDTMKGGQERPSVGIRNVYQRLKLYYGESAEVSISSEPDESTTVSLFIPKDISGET